MQQDQTPVPQQTTFPKEITPSIELIKNSISIYRQAFKKFFGMILIELASIIIMAVPIVMFVIFNDTFRGKKIIPILNIIFGIILLLALFAVIYISIATKAGMYLILKKFPPQEKVKEIFKEARKYVWKFFVVGVIVFVVVLLWSLLLIIPGIIFSVYYTFSGWALICEGHENTNALKRSKELVRGYWWAVVGRFFIFGIIIGVFFLILSAPLLFLSKGTAPYALWQFIKQLAQFFISPIVVIYSYLIFKELVKIKGPSKILVK